MLRSNLFAAASLASLCLSPDTGASAGGAAVAAAPAVTGEVVTPAAGTAPAATEPKKRGGRRPATEGPAARPFETAELAVAAPKSEGEEVHTVTKDGKTRYYVARHRSAVQTAILAADGYVLGMHGKTPRVMGNPLDTAKAAMDKMTDEQRRALFLQYMGSGNVAGAAALPAAEPRQDTTPAAEFDAAKSPAATAAATASGKGGSKSNKR